MEYIYGFMIAMFIMALCKPRSRNDYTMCDNCQNAYDGGQVSICDGCKDGSCYNPKERMGNEHDGE